MIAVIGSDGVRPVIWGIGATVEEAISEAETEGGECGWESHGACSVEVPAPLVERIKAGEVECKTLGIVVSVDRDGQIYAAEVRS